MILMNTLVSVIIPVYKVEMELPECLDSIINQTYKNLEIIIVNDGSPDNCGQICDEYAKRDSRIKVIHKENEGQSKARNTAVHLAQGEYVVFVDGDDIARNVYVEVLLDLLNKYDADMVVSPYQKFIDSKKLFLDTDCYIKIKETDNKAALKYLLYQNEIYHTSTHCKIFKKSLFNEIDFPIGFYYEDLATIYKLMFKCSKIVSTNQILYGYRIRNKSIMRQGYSEKMMSCIPISLELYKDISNTYPILEKAAASRAFSVNRSIYLQIPYNKKNERKQIWFEMKKYRKTVLFDKNARKRERMVALFSYLGADAMMLLSSAYKKQQMKI